MNRPQLLCMLLLGLSGPAFAAGDGDAKDAKPAADVADQVSATQGSVTVGGKTIAYTANAGLLVLKNDKGDPTANMSYVAYIANGQSAASRPVMFIYNGGPGSSTIWLHMASFGPKRAVVGDHDHTAPAAYQLVDNQYSLLDATDLVFVDAPAPASAASSTRTRAARARTRTSTAWTRTPRPSPSSSNASSPSTAVGT